MYCLQQTTIINEMFEDCIKTFFFVNFTVVVFLNFYADFNNLVLSKNSDFPYFPEIEVLKITHFN